MDCLMCKARNDSDALFCSSCGNQLGPKPAPPARGRGRIYLVALLVLPVIVIAAVGYYKFFPPQGVAAVVNGEEIKLSELDAAVARMSGARQASSPGIRRQALNELITERLVLQEASKSGIRVSADEVAGAIEESRTVSGLDETTFTREMRDLYGSMRGFEKALERRLIVRRLIAEKIVPPGTDQRAAAFAMNLWLREISSRAVVRVKLAEQVSGMDCACCNKPASRKQERDIVTVAGSPAPADQATEAEQAGLRYWREHHGPDNVTARSTEYGCHVQVDIVKNDGIIGSLRYQNGTISEM